MRILFIGDIVGRGGRKAVELLLPDIKKEENIDLVIANAENGAAGFGITDKVYEEFTEKIGVDLLTSGNHIWDKKELIENIDKYPKLLRPLNYPESVKGKGYTLFDYNGKKICLISLLGRVFVQGVDCPFRAMDKLLDEVKADIYLVDFHAEVTSEKKAMSYYLEKRVSLLVGTHTHVQTSDERILSDYTAYITDIGMVGGKESVIGMNKKEVLGRFLDALPYRFEIVKKGIMEFNSVVVEIDEDSGKALSIKRLNREIEVVG